MQAFVKGTVEVAIATAVSLGTVRACEDCVALIIRHTKVPRKVVVQRLQAKYPVFKRVSTTKGGI